ncbi:MAG TPA: hypothetical protein VHQ65_08130 [Thermoanaerobaculia bacterium]|nr:hypothetical protein [Thermoanaerobaculia bacterium]
MRFEVAFGLSLLVVVLLAVWAGRRAVVPSLGRRAWFAVLIDERERYSLNRLQVVLWTVLILSTFLALLVSGLGDPVARAAAFDIPPNLLILMGISAGTAAMAGAVKDGKNTTRPHKVSGSAAFLATARQAAPAPAAEMAAGVAPAEAAMAAAPAPMAAGPHFSQVVLEEEGQNAGQIVSVTKFQNLLFTFAVAAAYLAVLFETGTYPVFSDQVLWLLGISHAGYVGGKVPDKA